MAGDSVLLHPEPLVEPVGGADVLLANADRVFGDVVHRPVEQMVIAEHHQHIGTGRLQAPTHLRGGLQSELLMLFGGSGKPPREAR